MIKYRNEGSFIKKYLKLIRNQMTDIEISSFFSLLDFLIENQELPKDIKKVLPIFPHVKEKQKYLQSLGMEIENTRNLAKITNAIFVELIKTLRSEVEAIDLDLIVLKGAASNNYLYSETHRLAGDLDLLIRKNDKEKFINIAAKLGYVEAEKRKSKNPYEITLIPKKKYLPNIDLHFFLAQERLYEIDYDDLWNQSEPHPFYDSKSIRVLSAEYCFIHNAIHSLKDIKLNSYLLIDSFYLLQKKEICKEKLIKLAHSINVEHIVMYQYMMLGEPKKSSSNNLSKWRKLVFKIFDILDDTRIAEKGFTYRVFQCIYIMLLTNNLPKSFKFIVKSSL